VLTGIEYLEPNVIAALEAYAAGGGRVIASDDCTVQIKGAAKLGVAITSDIYKKAGEAFRKGAQEGRIAGLLARRPGVYFKAAAPVADALTKRCKDIGVLPALDCSNRQVFVSRQGQGDVEYFFAVNATCDESVLTGVEHMNAIKGASATIAVPDDGRPVYDAIYGDAASEFAKKGKTLTADLRFGAGQMRVYARTARPIGGVQVLSPVIRRDFTVEAGPQFAELTACVVDGGNRALAGAIPLEVKLLDPLGVTRYNLYRATDNGMLRLRLPLAINDPAGEWKLSVRELLSNTEGQASFAYKPPKQCGALAGATHRAVYFGNEPENVYRFLGRQKEITVVAGSSEFNSAAAARLADALKPWDVRCTVVPAADVKPRVLDDDAKKTWTGLVGGGSTGFDVRGGAILLGNPDDNQLIKYLRDQRFLPYAPDKAAFPGRGKAMIAWQVDGIGYYGIESVAVIAYDAAGMADGVGTLFEWASGLDPLTKWALPATAGVSPATKAPGFLPEPGIIWRAVLPDRVVAMKADGNTVSALTLDHSISTITAAGKVKSKEVSREDAAKQAAEWKQAVSAGSFPRDDAKAFDVPARVVKVIAKGDGATAVGYWGGLIRVYDANGVAVASIMMPHDVGAIVWLDGQLVAGLSDGTVAAMKTR